jgi:hypothetical protein
MELFKVVIEYDDLEAIREWNQKLEENSRNLVQHPYATKRFDIPHPKRLIATTYAAVMGEYGYGMIENAAKVALEKVIGKGQEAWEKFGAIVISAELIGSVGIQEIEKQQSEIEGGKK